MIHVVVLLSLLLAKVDKLGILLLDDILKVGEIAVAVSMWVARSRRRR